MPRANKKRSLGQAQPARRHRKIRGQYFTPEFVAEAAVDMCRRLLGDCAGWRDVVDPACGKGVFLQALLKSGVAPDQVHGWDNDPGLQDGWQPLLQRGVRVALCDGLAAPPPPGGAMLAIGNPPFGPLVDGQKIEKRFLRRFLELTREGGVVAVILPEGLLANARARTLRQEVAAQSQLLSVIGLPEGLFRGEGTCARTALVLLRKGRAEEPSRVLMASPGYAGAADSLKAYLNDVSCALSQRHGPAGPGWRFVDGQQLAEQRWDPGFWNPIWEGALAGVAYPDEALGRFIESITYGPIITSQKADPSALDDPHGLPVIGQRQFTSAGLDLTQATRVRPGSVYDVPRCRVLPGDLLLPRSGAGSLGRNRLAVYEGTEPATVSCFVNRIRLQDINPHYVAAVLQSRIGRLQIQRYANGVGTVNISFGEVRALRIPIAPPAVQERLGERQRLKQAGRCSGEALANETEAALLAESSAAPGP